MNSRFKEVREAMKMTRQKMAEYLGISPRTYEKYEYGTTPPAAFISLYCEKLGISENWLRTGEGEMIKEMTKEQQLAKLAAEILKDSTLEPEMLEVLIKSLAKISPDRYETITMMISGLADKEEKQKQEKLKE